MSAQPSIPLTAKAAVLAAHKQPYEIKDHPVTQPQDLKPGECLIRLEYSGVCHSDWSIKQNDWGRPSVLPLIGGHEGVGRIVALGENVGNVPVKIGDRVGVKVLGDICLHCEACRLNADACCPLSPQVAHGVRIPGTFAQYIVSYAKYVTPIPESIDGAAAAPLLCAGLTIYKALKTSNAKVGQWVAIGGAGGGLGHLGIQYAVAMGLRVIAIDTGEDKKQLCMKLGAEKWVDFKESEDIIKDVQAATDDGKGPHAAVIAIDNARPFNQALLYIRPLGTLVCVGMPGGTETSVNAPIHLLVGKSLTIVGSAVGNRQDAIEAVQLAASGKVTCQYQLRELNEINEVFDEMAAGKVVGRVVLKL